MKTHVGTIQSWRTRLVLCSTAILFAAPGTSADAAGQSMQAQMKPGSTPKTDAPTPPPAGVAGGAVGMALPIAPPPEAAARETVSDMFNTSITEDNVTVGVPVHEARQADPAANEAARAAMRADSSAAGAAAGAAAAARTKAERRATDKATERTNVKER